MASGGCWREAAELRREVAERVNPLGRPSALVFNCHITGLAVARSLGRRGVPVIGLDPEPGVYGLHSRHVAARGWCPNVLAGRATGAGQIRRSCPLARRPCPGAPAAPRRAVCPPLLLRVLTGKDLTPGPSPTWGGECW